MVQIYSDAGCTDYLIKHMDYWFPHQFTSLEHVEQFLHQFDALYAQISITMHQQYDPLIISKEREIQSLKEWQIKENDRLMTDREQKIKNLQKIQAQITENQNVIKTKTQRLGLNLRIKGQSYCFKMIYHLRRLIMLFVSATKIKYRSFQVHSLQNTVKQKIVREQTKYTSARRFLIDHRSFVTGAWGEERVIQYLRSLPDNYYLINDVTLSLYQSVYWKAGHEYVRSAQIDHIVIGPTGVFLLETKNWSRMTFNANRGAPHRQIARASFIAYLYFINRLGQKISTKNVVVTIRPMAKIDYPFVNQVSADQLKSFILSRQTQLDAREISRILQILT